MPETAARARALLTFVLVPLLVAAGRLAYQAYQDELDVEAVVGVVVFLVIAAAVGPSHTTAAAGSGGA